LIFLVMVMVSELRLRLMIGFEQRFLRSLRVRVGFVQSHCEPDSAGSV
jgi:hypothetical protein